MTQNQIAYWSLQETIRSNKANERLKGAANAETARSNVARETETNRHNQATEQQEIANLKQKQTELLAKYEFEYDKLKQEALLRELERNQERLHHLESLDFQKEKLIMESGTKLFATVSPTIAGLFAPTKK